MDGKRKASRAMSEVADALDGLTYILGLVYDDIQGETEMRDVGSVVCITRDVLAGLSGTLDEAEAALDGISDEEGGTTEDTETSSE